MNSLESTWEPFPTLCKLPGKLLTARLLGHDITKAQKAVLLEQFSLASSAHQAPPVTVMKCRTYEDAPMLQAFEKSLDSLAGLRQKLETARKILMKPNLIEARSVEEHATTNPLLLNALVVFLKRHAPDAEIVLAEGSGHDRDWPFVLRKTGIQDILAQDAVTLVNVNCDDVRVVTVDDPVTMSQVVLPECLCSADFVISCAKLKTHHWAGISCGMKNLFGCVPGSVYGFPKNRLHWMSLPRVIADLVWTVKPDLTLIDGIMAIEGNGPLDGTPRAAGVIIAGTDAFATDCLAAQLIGFAPLLLPQFWYPVLYKHAGPPLQADWGELPHPLPEPFAPPPNMPWLYNSAGKSPDALSALLDDITL